MFSGTQTEDHGSSSAGESHPRALKERTRTWRVAPGLEANLVVLERDPARDVWALATGPAHAARRPGPLHRRRLTRQRSAPPATGLPSAVLMIVGSPCGAPS